jgi:hypothetical protein
MQVSEFADPLACPTLLASVTEPVADTAKIIELATLVIPAAIFGRAPILLLRLEFTGRPLA